MYMFKFTIGDRVTTIGHGYNGVITRYHLTCPQDNEWLSIQSIPVLAEHVRSYWYSIAVDPLGSIVCAEDDLRLNDSP